VSRGLETRRTLSPLRIILRSLWHYRRANLAVLLGAAVGVAVVTGSLAVGDSFTGSLRHLALERLGRTDHALVASGFFRAALADDLARGEEFSRDFSLAAPAVFVDATAVNPAGPVALPRTTVLAVDDRFWRLNDSPPPEGLAGRSAAINRFLADDLGAKVGDTIILNLQRPTAAPVASMFGRRKPEETVDRISVTVGCVIPDEGVGRFSLRSDRLRPRNLYVSLGWFAKRLRREGRANVLLVAGRKTGEAEGRGGTLSMLLDGAVALDDYGLRLLERRREGILWLESRRTVLSPRMVETARKAADLCRYRTATASVYLANSITRLKAPPSVRPIPYSTIAGIDLAAGPPFGPLVSAGRDKLPESLGDDGILLNTWAADNLGAGVGEQVEVTFYRVAEGGQLVTDARRFAVRGIVAMEGLAAGADLVPEFEGLTNADSLRGWKPPFPLDLSRIRKADDLYWERYRATPKAFVSLETAKRFWDSEGRAAGLKAGGWVTSVRVAPSAAGVAGVGGELSAEKFAATFMSLLPPREAGLAFRPVKDEALRAARGSSDFAALFLGLSSFLVISAGLLVGLLMRLSAASRAREAGLMLALGFAPRAVTRTLMLEGLILAVAAAVVGVPLGIAYARGIIAGLATLWADLLGPFTLTLHVGAASLAIGAAAGIGVAMAAMWWSVRVLRRRNALTLLVGWRGLLTDRLTRRGRGSVVVVILSLALAAAVLVLALAADAISSTIAFFLSGALLLVAGMAGAVALSASSSRPGSAGGPALSIRQLAFRYARLRRVRSALTVGLLASASFAVVAVAANRNDLSLLDTSDRASGAGGFALLADAELPIHLDLNTAEGRRRAGLLDESPFRGATILPLRLQRGDDASCLNLQRVQSPRVVGVPRELVVRGGFSFADVEPLQGTKRKPANPWELLDQELADGSVPVIGDEASVKWILHRGLGETVTVDGPDGGIHLRIVGLLRGSIWQSELLMSERHFTERFGSEGGYRRFLIDVPAGRQAALAEALRGGLAELGFDVRRTADVLARYAGVQNAYLSAFHTLGGLALVLGTFGVVTVLLRNIVERRGELGLMLAVGFQKRQLVRLVVLETGLLVLLGLAIGSAAGLVAVAPHLVAARADVPWWHLAATMAGIALVALVACVVATRRAVGAELLAAIRSE